MANSDIQLDVVLELDSKTDDVHAPLSPKNPIPTLPTMGGVKTPPPPIATQTLPSPRNKTSPLPPVRSPSSPRIESPTAANLALHANPLRTPDGKTDEECPGDPRGDETLSLSPKNRERSASVGSDGSVQTAVTSASQTSVAELAKIAAKSDGCAACFLNNLLEHRWIWWWGYLIANTCWMGLMFYLTFNGETRHNQEWFWIAFGIKTFILSVVQLVAGWGAQNKGWKVGYTRKCVHVGFFLIPELLDVLLPLPEDDTWLWGLWNIHLISWMLFMITRPIRERFGFVKTMYAAVDRPEDHGLTMLYTMMQVPLTILVIAGFSLVFKYWVNRQAWILAPIIAVTFGDGLAEPVAVYWSQNKVCGGTHKYQTSAICAGDKKFTRSLEGSATVFLFTAVGILILINELTDVELAINLLVMPITMSLLEAVAPHSMDNPFLLTWGCLVMIAAHGIDQWAETW